MPQTRDNGIVVPINSDAYNLTADLAKMADTANVVTVVSGTTARNALTKYEGRLVYRTDTQQIESVVSGSWQTGTVQYAPLSPTGWSSAGTITVTPEGAKKRVVADLVITRTGGAFTLASGTWSTLGTDENVLPASARGTSPVKYLSCAVVGAGNNYTANVAFDPAGPVKIRSISPFSMDPGTLFTINVAYYI